MNALLQVGLRLLPALLVFAVSVTPLEAQQRRGMGQPPREQLEGMVRERFQMMVTRELGLDASQADRLAAVVQTHQAERAGLTQRSVQLRRRLMTADAGLSAAEAEAILEELVAVQNAEASLLQNELAQLRTVLSPAQTVRFFALRDRLAERMRRLRDGGTPRGGGLVPGGVPR